MMQAEGCAVVVGIDRPSADAIDQTRQPRAKRAAFETGAMGERDDRRLRGRRRKGAERRRCGIIVGDQPGTTLVTKTSRRLFGALSSAAVVRPSARQTCRSTIFNLSSAIASEGLSPLGQALAQFMMVWQR